MEAKDQVKCETGECRERPIYWIGNPETFEREACACALHAPIVRTLAQVVYGLGSNGDPLGMCVVAPGRPWL